MTGDERPGAGCVRVVVVGRQPTEAAAKLRPFRPSLDRFGLRLLVVPEPESIRLLDPGPMVVVVPVDVTGYGALAAVTRIRRDAVLVASVEHLTRGSVALAVDYGAQAVVSWEDDPDQAVESLWAATRGFVRRSVLTALRPPCDAGGALSSEERQWLMLLEAGVTIPAVAAEVHRSESDLKRRLRRLYDRLHAGGVRDALVIAHQQGWLR